MRSPEPSFVSDGVVVMRCHGNDISGATDASFCMASVINTR